MLALVVACELRVARIEPGLLGDPVRLAWRASGEAALREATGAEVLCVGDSLARFGVLPRVLEAGLGRSAYNLATPGGQAASSYFLLRRALAAGARPGALIVEFHTTFLALPPRTSARSLPELLGVREMAELAWDTHDPALFAPIGLAVLVPSIRRREDLRDEARAALRGEPRRSRELVAAWLRNWRRNGGASPQPRCRPPREEPLPPDGTGRWVPYPINARYVSRTLQLAEAHRIPVFWLIPPVSPAWQARNERQGVDRGLTRFLRATQARFPGLVVLDARGSGYGRDVFIDAIHLDRRGASALSVSVSEAIAAHLDARRPVANWVGLPACRPLGDDSPMIEDLAQSLSALRAESSRVR